MHKRCRTVSAGLAALAAVTMCAAFPGQGNAEDPVRLARKGRVTDEVDAVGERAAQLRTALDRLYAAQRIQLFVTYVGGFSGRTPQDWANATAVTNGLGRSDVLLAVATHDHEYAVSADQDSGLTQAQLDEVGDAAVQPALSEDDWAGAAIGAANGYEAVLSGRPVPPPDVTPGAAAPAPDPDTDNTSGDLWIPVVAVAVGAAVGAYAYRRRRIRHPAAERGEPTGQIRTWDAKRPTPLTPLPELDHQARRLLVATDDAVRTSREDAGCAAAQRGDRAAKPFGEAVDYAQGELTAAFRLRQQLDDAYPRDDETRRQLLDEILSRCTQANRRLDAESEAFDRLRALAANAPQVLERAEAAAAGLPDRIAHAEAALGLLAQRYADAALEPVAGHPAEARDRLEFARTGLDRARALIGTDAAGAAARLRGAESALSQAAVLVDCVTRRERELHEADGALRVALAETDADLTEARRAGAAASEPGAGPEAAHAAGPHAGLLRDRIARTETVIADAGKELAAGHHDPLAALRRVVAVDAALGESLSGSREPHVAGRRARALLGQALLTARSEVAAAGDLITTHRGAIGSRARTRLSEAERRLGQAESAGGGRGDCRDALAHAQEADRLAREALDNARQDVRDDGGYGSGFGGHGGGRHGGGGTDGVGGAVLGGILLGGRDRGGGDDGDPAGGPGSFGGGETRARMRGVGLS